MQPAKRVTYRGINYDSKLEAVWSVFMEQALDWNTLPHPEYLLNMGEIKYWLPDFLFVTPVGNNILIDVKGIRKTSEWHDPEAMRFKSYANMLQLSKSKILDKSEWNAFDYKVLIVGYKLRLDRDTLMLSEKKCIVPFGLLYEPSRTPAGYTYAPVTFVKHADDEFIDIHFAKVNDDECYVCGEDIDADNYFTMQDEKRIASVFNRIRDYFEQNVYLNE